MVGMARMQLWNWVIILKMRRRGLLLMVFLTRREAKKTLIQGLSG